MAWIPFGAQAETVQVAVAANFAAPMKALASAFERSSGHRAVLVVGSTGSLYAQIRHGAPFAVLLSADSETPQRLETDGLTVPGTRFTYATGQLVLWSAQPGLVDAHGEVLRKPGLGRVALANPKLAPYGRAAQQTLDKLGLLPSLQARLVQGESITQAYQFVASGNAALGFVALSQVLTDGQMGSGSAWLVPQALYAPLRQDAVLLSAGRDQRAARALLQFLKTEPARALMARHGYTHAAP